MGDDGTQERSSGLTSQLDQRRIDFLKADLKTCFTFASLAATELEIGDLEAVRRVIAKAERGHEMINRFLTVKKGQADRQAITQRHFEDLYASCKVVADTFGRQTRVVNLTTADFEQLLLSEPSLRGYVDANGLSDVNVTVLFRKGDASGYAALSSACSMLAIRAVMRS